MNKTTDQDEVIEHSDNNYGKLSDIVNYWNEAGLCSFDSSTSHKNIHIASFENYVESKLLSGILENYLIQNNDKKIGLDVGAGTGRFSVILARYLDHVYAIEPALKLYMKLKERCKNFQNISVINSSLEAYESPLIYDVAIVSGILYLYDDEMMSIFMDKLHSNLKENAWVIIRDFIVTNDHKKIKSSYVEGAYCHYRNPDYWQSIANKWDMDLIEIFKATPTYNPLIAKLITNTVFSRLFNISWLKKRIYLKMKEKREKNGGFSEGIINTVFIVLVKKEG